MNRAAIWGAVVASLGFFGGCKASMSAESDAQLPEYQRPIEDDPSAVDGDSLGGDTTMARAGQTLVGARPDLELRAENPTATCECLAVAVGSAGDSAFFWQSEPPSTGADQLVIALSSAGQSCPAAPADSPGASYWGFRQEGADVVVVVEFAREGRPLTTGAVIPRPGVGGAVYVTPQSARVPYGRSLVKGEKYCRVSAAAAP